MKCQPGEGADDRLSVFTPWRWLCDHREHFSLAIRTSLMQALLGRTSSVIMGSLTVMLLVLVTLMRLPGSRWPLPWFVLEAVVLGGRLAMLPRTRRALARGELGPFYRYTGLATLWCVLLGLGALGCVTTGDGVLAALAAITVFGVAAGISTLSAAFPRLATLQILLVGMPYAIGAAFTPAPWFFVLAIDVPVFMLVMSSLTRMHHADRVNLIRAERANWFLAAHDTLTGLPNRKSLLDRLDGLCAPQSGGTDAIPFAVLCLDLNGFKAVNDAFGHPVGDQLLVVVARRLKQEVREADLVARTGGDEFIILLPGADDAEAARVSGRIIEAIARPIALEFPTDLVIGVTIGSACAPGDGGLAALLLSRADQALYAAKRAQRGTYQRYAGPAQPARADAA